MRTQRHLPKLLLSAVLFACLLVAQEPVDTETNAKIRQEATEHSKVMQVEHMLTDRYGPRLTGSPNYEAAAKWAVATMTDWGLKNAHLEPWDFGHPGWVNERASGYMVAPIRSRLTFEVLAWTPSTAGDVKAGIAQLAPPVSPTKEELAAWLDSNVGKVKGKIVLVGKAAVIAVNFSTPRSKRMDDAQAKARFVAVSTTSRSTPGGTAARAANPAGKTLGSSD